MKRFIRISLRVLAVIVCLLILGFIGGWIYLAKHKKEVITFIESKAKENLNGGEILLSDISLGFGHTFPRISFTIDSLVVRDSLWSQHHHDLAKIPRAYASLNFFNLIFGKIAIGRIDLEKPAIYLFTDSNHYDNTSMFKQRGQPKKTDSKTTEFPIIRISDGLVTIDKQDKHKLFGFEVHRLEAKIRGNEEDRILDIDLNLDCKVQHLIFNMERGPYLENKAVSGRFPVRFNPATGILEFRKIKLKVDNQPFTFTGKFFLKEIPTPFKLDFETERLAFRKAASFLATNIREKLKPYDISGTITRLTGSLDNSEAQYLTPQVHIRLNVEDQTVITPMANIGNSSFTATFNNEEIRGKGHEDSNTVMHFSPLRANWNSMDFQCDSLVIRNLIHPRMYMHVTSRFRLEPLNNIFDETVLSFPSGSGRVDLLYNCSLESQYDSLRMLSGSFNLDSATIQYVPRKLLFTNGTGVIRFTGKDMIVDQLSMNSGTTDLVMSGSVKSLFYLISQKNKKMAFEWSIRSNKLNLNDFTSFLSKKQQKVSAKKKQVLLAETMKQFTNLLQTANIQFNLAARQMIYKKFNAENLMARINMDDDAIRLQDIKLQHAGGTISLQGSLLNESSGNPFSVQAELKNINVSRIFYAFNNFGLKSPTDKNLSGLLSADITMKGGFTSKAVLIPDQTHGFVKFNLQDGQLINFEPVQKIQETVFKERNFSDVHFAELHDLLEINGEDVLINRMEIRSSVITMFVEGNYNIKTGPDLSIQVPLNNLKSKRDTTLVNKGINSKTGISARLRARRGDDGKVKIAWDPFNKAGKEKKKKKK